MDRDFESLNLEEKKEANADHGGEEESGWEENRQEADKKTGRERGRTRKQSVARKKELRFEKGKEKEHWEWERRF